MKNYFLPGSAAVVIFAAILPAILSVSSGGDAFQKRLTGIWDIDDTASWEFQNPGEAYTPSTVELWRNISLRFDTEEQTCLVQTALGNELIRYRVVSEEKDQGTLNIGEQTLTFEFKARNKIVFCPANSGIAGCLVMTKGSMSAEAEAKRIAKAEQRLAEIIKLYTHTVAVRSLDILADSFGHLEQRLSSKEYLRLYLAEIAALGEKGIGADDKNIEETTPLMQVILHDEIENSNLNYGRIYTSTGKPILFSDFDAPLSEQQVEDIKNTAGSGKPGPIVSMTVGNKTFFECYLPVSPPEWLDRQKNSIVVLALARLMQNVFAEALNFNFQVPQGNIYLIQFTGKNYQIIGAKGILREVQAIDFNESRGLSFAHRGSLVNADSKVYSQASPGPAVNSWILFETKLN